MTESAGNVATFRILVCFDLQISDVNSLPFENGTAHSSPMRQGRFARVVDWNGPMVGDKPEDIPVPLNNQRVVGIAEAGRANGYVREHALQVRRRVRNCSQDLCGGGLLLSGVGKLSALSFELPFQLLDQAAKVLVRTRWRLFGWHDPRTL
jgi:hypothetical protein